MLMALKLILFVLLLLALFDFELHVLKLVNKRTTRSIIEIEKKIKWNKIEMIHSKQATIEFNLWEQKKKLAQKENKRNSKRALC